MLESLNTPEHSLLLGQRFFVVTFALGLVLAVLAIGAMLELRGRMLSAFGALGTINVLQGSRDRSIDYLIDFYDELRFEPNLVAGAATLAGDRQRASFAEQMAALQTASRHDVELRPWIEQYVSAANAAFAALTRAPQAPVADAATLSQSLARAQRSSDELESLLHEELGEQRAILQNELSRIIVAVGALIAGIVLVSLAQAWELLAMGRRFFAAQDDSAKRIANLSSTLSESRVALDELNKRLTLAMRSAHVVVFSTEPSAKVTWSHDAGGGVFGDLATPFQLTELAPEADRARILEHVFRASRSEEAVEFEMKVERGDLDPHWVKVTLLPLGAEDESGLLGSAVDVTDMKRRDEGNVLLLRELSHRSKNLLAIVQAMARQTARTAGSPVQFYERFSARLRALAAGHDLLVKTVYADADLGELIRSQIGELENLIGSRVFAEGPPVRLRPEATQNLGMALHELATNAQIHGAMTSAQGRIHISWRLEGSGADGHLIIDWVESAGPTVAPSDRRGFGSTLILENLPRSLHGEVTLDYFPEGARCHMDLPFRYTLERCRTDDADKPPESVGG